jgi:hypothetical protein
MAALPVQAAYAYDSHLADYESQAALLSAKMHVTLLLFTTNTQCCMPCQWRLAIQKQVELAVSLDR